MSKLKLREVKEHAHGHTACKWQSKNWTQSFCFSNSRTWTRNHPWIKLPLTFRKPESLLGATCKRFPRIPGKPIETLRGAPGYSRCKRWVVLCTSVVGIQIEHPNHEGHKYHDKNDHKLEDIFHGSPQGDLQGPKTLIGRQDVCNSRKTQHDSYCI